MIIAWGSPCDQGNPFRLKCIKGNGPRCLYVADIPSIRKLQYVLTVARELHFRKAAEKLNVAQPSLSRQVRECEEAVGFEIFRRDNHFVSPTKAGRAFVKD